MAAATFSLCPTPPESLKLHRCNLYQLFHFCDGLFIFSDLFCTKYFQILIFESQPVSASSPVHMLYTTHFWHLESDTRESLEERTLESTIESTLETLQAKNFEQMQIF